MDVIENRSETQVNVYDALCTLYPEEVVQIIQGLTLMDDNFFSKCMENNIPAAELIIRIILGMEDLEVLELRVQYEIKNAIVDGRGIRMDVLAKDSTGNYFNIEVQNASKGADVHRARFNSAMMDTMMLKKQEEFLEIRESYMIFFTKGDFFGEGFPLYHINRIIEENGKPFGDGNHIIYVNGNNQDLDTPLGQLVHDFKCADPDKFYYDDLKQTVSHFKKTQEGAETMCQSVEEYAKKYEAKGISIGRNEGISIGRNEGISIGRNEGISIGRNEGISIGRNEGISIGRQEGQKDLLKKLVALGKLTPEEAAQF